MSTRKFLCLLFLAAATSLAPAQPRITSVVPLAARAGTIVAITGANFHPVPASNIVHFGAVRARVTGAATNALTVNVPGGATYAPITVTVNGLTAFAGAPFVLTLPTTHVLDLNTFVGPADTILGATVQSLALGDLDGDGKADLVTASSGADAVSVLPNISTVSNITFATRLDFATELSPQSVALGDLDGDGRLDVAAANLGSDTISVLRNTSAIGSISLAAQQKFDSDISPASIAIADLDGDGRPDLVVANSGSDTLSVFRNTSTPGSISFAPQVNFDTGFSPYSVAVADLDGDGKPDLAVANLDADTVSVLRNVSSPGSLDTNSFAARIDFAAGAGPYQLVIGDVDGDGKLDLVAANSFGDSASIFRNTSSGAGITTNSFAPPVDIFTGNNPLAVALGDADGDGRPDLVVARVGGSALLQNTSASGAISFGPKIDLPTSGGYSAALGDLDGDGLPDLALGNTSLAVTILRNGLATAPVITSQPQSQTITVGSSASFDVTATGTPPLAYRWNFNDSPILNATNATLTLTNVQPINAGNYSVIITNSLGSVTSVVATLSVQSCASPPAGLVAWWRAEGNALDSLGTNHGALLNGATFAPGKTGQAFSFTGINSVEIPHSPNLSFAPGSSMTVQLWAYRTANQLPYHIIGKRVGCGATDWNYMIGIDNTVPDTPLNTWIHWTLVFDQSGSYVYTNGSLCFGFPGATLGPENTVPLTIGTAGSCSGFTGLIDEVAIFNRALSSNEIAAIYAAGSGGICPPPPNAPVILVNGQFYGNNTAIFTSAAPVTVEMRSAFTNATIFYSLDGTSPNFGTLYTGPFTLSDSALLRAVAYNSNFTQSAESDAFVLSLTAPPVIAQQPQSRTVIEGDSATFSVSASGPGRLAYQWLFNGSPLAGATNTDLTLNNVQAGSAGPYSVAVSNAFGSVTSSVAALTLLTRPGFAALPPAAVDVVPGTNITLCVTASGTPPFRYQWWRNGVNLPDETNACFTITNVSVTDGGRYSVVVANDAGAAESPSVVLNVIVAPTPPGDNFAQRTPILGATNFVVGTNVLATREAGEPFHASKRGSNSVWYTWTAPATGIATFRTAGSSFDTLLAVYTGTNVTNLVTVASDEDGAGFLTSRLRFNAGQGTNYAIAIDGFAGEQGNFVLVWELLTTAAVLPVITNQPASQTVTAGASWTFSVGATGSGLGYQWYFNGAVRAGATNTSLTIGSVQPADVGAYTVRVRNNTLQEVESLAAILEIGPVAGVQSVAKYADLFGPPAGNGLISGKSKNLVAATVSGGSIPVSPGTIVSQILNNTPSSNAVVICGGFGGSVRWLSLKPTSNGTLIIDTAGSSIDTIMEVSGVSNVFDRVPIGCTTNAAAGGQSVVQFQATQGVEYQVAVAGNNRAEGLIQVNWRFGQPPVLTGLPDVAPALRAARDGSVTLAVSLNQALPTPGFQWFHGPSPRPGATGPSLTLTNLLPQDAGEYYIVVSNLMGFAVGHVATLLVEATALRVSDSTFDAGTEDWTADGNAGSIPPVFIVTPGTRGGYLTAQYAAGGQTWYWRAPARFRGNQSAAYGGYLAFDLKQSFTDLQFDDSDVILVGGGLTLVFDTTANPGTNWTTYQVPLQESAGWRLSNQGGRLATKAELLHALSSVTDLRIRGDYSLRLDPGNLDNVALVAPSTAVSAILVSRLVSTNLVFEWPVLGGFQLEAASTLPFNSWAVLLPLSVSNGLNRAAIDTSSGSFFFRLTKPAP